MGELDNFGTLRIKNSNSKDIELECRNTSDNITLLTDAATNEYTIKLPNSVPTAGQTFQASTNINNFRWENPVNFEEGTDVNTAIETDNNRIYAETSTGNIYYRINNGWKRINNWLTTEDLAAYNAVDTDRLSIHHEIVTNTFYIAGTAWYRLELSPYSEPQFINMNSADIPGGSVVLPHFTDNFLAYNDSFKGDTSNWNNLVGVMKDWDSPLPTYIEWEVSSVDSSAIDSMGCMFGFLNYDIVESLIGTESITNYPEPTTDWGVDIRLCSETGYQLILRNAVNGPFKKYRNNTFDGTGGPPPTGEQEYVPDNPVGSIFLTQRTVPAYNIEYGDRFQFLVNTVNNIAELCYIKNNNLVSFVRDTDITNWEQLNKKVYVASSNGHGLRVSRNPLPYMGQTVHNGYVLSLPNL